MKKVLILAGPSAGGKTTVANLLLHESSEFELVRSVTSRPPRGDGNDGEYIYISKEEFKSAIESSDVLEYTEYAGELYGTPISEIDRITKEGRVPLLILDINGVKALTKSDCVSACAVYVYDDIRVVDQRLYDRYLGISPSADALIKYVNRKEQNNADYLAAPEFSESFYSFVKNTIPEECASVVRSAFKAFASGEKRDADAVNLAVDFMISTIRQAYM